MTKNGKIDKMIRIKISSDFNEYPSGRDDVEGEWNGERFRKNFLIPNLTNNQRVVVDLDGLKCIPATFLDSAFGMLIRADNIPIEYLKEHLSIVCTETEKEKYIKTIWEYIDRSQDLKDNGFTYKYREGIYYDRDDIYFGRGKVPYDKSKCGAIIVTDKYDDNWWLEEPQSTSPESFDFSEAVRFAEKYGKEICDEMDDYEEQLLNRELNRDND